MACFKPLQGFRTSSGKIVFSQDRAVFQLPQKVTCGQCIGCRLERSRLWAVRCVHESSMHDANSFLTLTYDNDHLPDPPTLVLKHFQDFAKRLRKAVGKKIKIMHCGEYGERFGRPHYHALIFGFDFPDKIYFKKLNGNVIFTSDLLKSLWKFGNSAIGDLTFDSAAYVARYALKKVTGKQAEVHYSTCPISGEVFSRKPEYCTTSRRPGIGKEWIEKFLYDTYKDDFVVVNGKKLRPPKYYDNVLESVDPDLFNKVISDRKSRLNDLKSNDDFIFENSDRRLSDKLKFAESVFRSRSRCIE